MNLRTKLTAITTAAALVVLSVPAGAQFLGIGKKKKDDLSQILRKPTAAQNALIDKAIAREAVIIKTVRERSPLVETYIQNMKPDPVMGETPESDTHFLARVDFGKVIGQEGYATEKHSEPGKLGFLKGSLAYITGLSRSLHLAYNDGGFVRMILIDTSGPNADGFNRQNYTFSYVRNDFLGTIPTVLFDVQPTHKTAGRFIGRIWIERNGGNIVRYSGDLAGTQQDISEYFHFESWRTNVQEGLWLPTSSYIEETDPKSPSHVLKFKAVNNIWGYQLKIPPKEAEETDIQVGGGVVDQSNQASDVGPLEAQRDWIQQAEDNVVERLFVAGLIDAPSDFDKTLSDLANNILAYNQIATTRPIKVRTLLTEPLESLSIGNTILLSKSLIDTTAVQSETGAQQMGNLNALLAFQIAHVILGHRIDTKYAFSDRLLFPNEAAFQRLPMGHTDADNASAAKKALQLLSAKELVDGQQYFGLYLQQLKARESGLKALTTPQIGDSLVKPDGGFWLQAMIPKSPRLNDKDLKQQAAMPLTGFLRYDPWTDQVIQMHTTYEPLLSERDKLPFEITPVFLKLAYYQPPAPPAPAATTPAAAPADNAAPATPGTTSPADTTTTNTVPTNGAPVDNTVPATNATPTTTVPATPASATPNPASPQ